MSVGNSGSPRWVIFWWSATAMTAPAASARIAVAHIDPVTARSTATNGQAASVPSTWIWGGREAHRSAGSFHGSVCTWTSSTPRTTTAASSRLTASGSTTNRRMRRTGSPAVGAVGAGSVCGVASVAVVVVTLSWRRTRGHGNRPRPAARYHAAAPPGAGTSPRLLPALDLPELGDPVHPLLAPVPEWGERTVETDQKVSTAQNSRYLCRVQRLSTMEARANRRPRVRRSSDA